MDQPRIVMAEDHAGIAEQLRERLEPEFRGVGTDFNGNVGKGEQS